MQDKNSKFSKLFSFAKLATLRSSVAAPATTIFFSKRLLYEKSFPNFITTPLTPLSLNNILDPAPNIVVFNFFLFASYKNSIS